MLRLEIWPTGKQTKMQIILTALILLLLMLDCWPGSYICRTTMPIVPTMKAKRDLVQIMQGFTHKTCSYLTIVAPVTCIVAK